MSVEIQVDYNNPLIAINNRCPKQHYSSPIEFMNSIISSFIEFIHSKIITFTNLLEDLRSVARFLTLWNDIFVKNKLLHKKINYIIDLLDHLIEPDEFLY
jgi:hypothetical protein